jgi:hypothetical protein
MKLTRTQRNGISLAVLEGEGILISTVQDAVDLLGNADYLGSRIAVVREEQLDPDFFILRTRLAGEILQKFSNYRMKLVIIGDFSKYSSKSLHDFIRESNRAGRIVFAKNMEEAIERFI